jgi:hypothetical protein
MQRRKLRNAPAMEQKIGGKNYSEVFVGLHHGFIAANFSL